MKRWYSFAEGEFNVEKVEDRINSVSKLATRQRNTHNKEVINLAENNIIKITHIYFRKRYS